MRQPFLFAIASLILIQIGIASASAQRAATDSKDMSVFVFVGESVRGFDNYPFESTYGEQQFAGVSGNWTPIELPAGFKAGLDVGLSIREDGDGLGPSGTSGEVWLGPTLVHDGFELGPVILRPAFTAGFSAVTESNGLERTREIEEDGNAALLYYLGPELGIALRSNPNWSFIYRFHHRSGASEVDVIPTIGSIGDTMNASTFGLRYRF